MSKGKVKNCGNVQGGDRALWVLATRKGLLAAVPDGWTLAPAILACGCASQHVHMMLRKVEGRGGCKCCQGPASQRFGAVTPESTDEEAEVRAHPEGRD